MNIKLWCEYIPSLLLLELTDNPRVTIPSYIAALGTPKWWKLASFDGSNRGRSISNSIDAWVLTPRNCWKVLQPLLHSAGVVHNLKLQVHVSLSIKLFLLSITMLLSITFLHCCASRCWFQRRRLPWNRQPVSRQMEPRPRNNNSSNNSSNKPRLIQGETTPPKRIRRWTRVARTPISTQRGKVESVSICYKSWIK